MRITITEPASAHPRLPQPGGWAYVLAPHRFLPLRVVSAELHGDEVTLVLEMPNAEVHLKGEPVKPQWADWNKPMPEPADHIDGLPVWDVGNAEAA